MRNLDNLRDGRDLPIPDPSRFLGPVRGAKLGEWAGPIEAAAYNMNSPQGIHGTSRATPSPGRRGRPWRRHRARAASVRKGGRAADWCTVGLGAARAMIVSAYGFDRVLQPGRAVLDPSRVAAQVISGISFLGRASSCVNTSQSTA